MVVKRTSGARLRITAGHNRDVDGERWLPTSQRTAHTCRAEVLRVYSASAERCVHAAVPTLIQRHKAQMRQAVDGATATGRVDHLEQCVTSTTEAPVQRGAERPQVAQPD